MNTEEAVTLVEYNTWANHRVLLKAGRLSREQLNMQAGLSHASSTWHPAPYFGYAVVLAGRRAKRAFARPDALCYGLR